MKRRDVLTSLAAAPAALAINAPTHAAMPAPATAPVASFDFAEWLLLHAGAREVSGAPGWVYKAYGPEDTGAPYSDLHVRNRDGREFNLNVGIYTRAVDGTPFNKPFDWNIVRELHQRYPEEYPAPPTYDDWDLYMMRTWEPKIHLDLALTALVEQKDMAAYDRHLKNAARAMGVELA